MLFNKIFYTANLSKDTEQAASFRNTSGKITRSMDSLRVN